MPDFDAIIIGTGQAGPSLPFRLAGAGMKVAVVERHLVGGTCVTRWVRLRSRPISGDYLITISVFGKPLAIAQVEDRRS
jgi:cation diffusion facilitator CzcD-associated flavoprotein CzcO